jgi:hypothetical protein
MLVRKQIGPTISGRLVELELLFWRIVKFFQLLGVIDNPHRSFLADIEILDSSLSTSHAL